jgi:hypothetical protein
MLSVSKVHELTSLLLTNPHIAADWRCLENLQLSLKWHRRMHIRFKDEGVNDKEESFVLLSKGELQEVVRRRISWDNKGLLRELINLLPSALVTCSGVQSS